MKQSINISYKSFQSTGLQIWNKPLKYGRLKHNPGGFMAAESIIEITDKAKAQIVSIFAKEEASTDRGLRVGVIGGGCSGLSYKIEFSNKKDSDNILVYEGFQVFIDPKSAIYLKDSVLDFSDGLKGKGFIFTNPNAQNTCGCGESFSL